MALGNIVRLVAQLVVPIVATIVRALPTAYAEALHNAKKTGTQEVLRRGAKTMSKSEAMQILNVTEAEVTSTPEAVQKHFEKYFAANDVTNGGSFYLQSKVYRAKEMLDEFIREKREEEKQQGQQQQQQQQEKQQQRDDSTSTTTQPPR